MEAKDHGKCIIAGKGAEGQFLFIYKVRFCSGVSPALRPAASVVLCCGHGVLCIGINYSRVEAQGMEVTIRTKTEFTGT